MKLQRIMKIICTTFPGWGGHSEAGSSWFFRKKGHLGSFGAMPPVCHLLAKPDTPTFISGLNAWTVVLVVEHEEYLGAVDLTSDVVNIPTGLASYFLV